MGISAMSWPHYKEIVTVIDVLESGACIDGVCDWLNKLPLISGVTKLHIGNEHIANAANADGDGDGSGSGSGYGDGSGSGSGSGYGYGDGYGDGSGSGDGSGYGDGSGNGSGSLAT
jgi:hypothetical protein